MKIDLIRMQDFGTLKGYEFWSLIVNIIKREQFMAPDRTLFNLRSILIKQPQRTHLNLVKLLESTNLQRNKINRMKESVKLHTVKQSEKFKLWNQ